MGSHSTVGVSHTAMSERALRALATAPMVCLIAAAASLGMHIYACFPECTSVYSNWDTHFQAGLCDPVGAVKRLDPEVEGNSGKLRMETKVS